MKRKFIIVVAVALLVAPVFAQVTVSGDFKAEIAYEFRDGKFGEKYQGKDNKDNDISFNIDGKVGDFTSIDIGITPDAGKNIKLDEMSITQDLFKAFGLDLPVSLSYTFGNSNFEAIRPFDEMDPIALPGGNELDLNLKLGLADLGFVEMLNLSLGFVPKSYTNQSNDKTGGEFGAIVDGVFGPVTAAVSFMYTQNGIAVPNLSAIPATTKKATVLIDGERKTVGGASKAVDKTVENARKSTGIEVNFVADFLPLTVKEQFQIANLNDAHELGIFLFNYTKVEYALDMGLTFGAKYVMSKTAKKSPVTQKVVSSLVNGSGVDIAYAITDMAQVDAKFEVTDFTKFVDSIKTGAGGHIKLDGAEYGLDYVFATVKDKKGTHTVKMYVKGSF